MKQTYDALLFDMDGVLINVTKSYRKAIQQTARYFLKRGVTMTEINTVKEKVGMNNDWDTTYALINKKELSYCDVKNIFQKIYWGNKGKNGLINNEQLLLSKKQLLLLKKKYKKMGIVTGRPREEAQYALDTFRLQEIFNVLVTREDVKKQKPFPDSIFLAMKIISSQKTVYIGDSPSDVEAARAAGIPSIYIGKQKIGTIRFKSVLQVVDYLL